MIVVFDLDDTLYEEIQFVKGGFQAVAKLLSHKLHINEKKINIRLMQILLKFGRGKVFNQLLKENNIKNLSLIKKCLSVYRSHSPKIKLYKDAKKLISTMNMNPYIVTDGNKIVQKRKIKFLNLENKVKKAFVTHNYGINHAKPSIYCFKKIKDIENIKWQEMIYIGDNPQKDFVNLNKLGVKTVRVMKGPYKLIKVKKSFDAKYKINNLLQVTSLFNLSK